MIDDFFNFITANASSIIISISVGLIFFVLGPLGLWFSKRKIRREKVKKAQENLLDIVEGMLVNDEDITENRLSSLFFAVSRENGINLEVESDIENLLEDLILRFERSKHLSSQQKDTYIKKIESLQVKLFKVEQSSTERREIPKSFKRIIDDLEENINQNKLDKAQIEIKHLKERLLDRVNPFDKIFSVYFRIYKRNPLLFIIATIIVLVGYIYLITILTK